MVRNSEKRQKEGRTEPAPTAILVVLMLEMRAAGGADPVRRARTRAVLSDAPGTRDKEIRKAVAALFKTYPPRAGKDSRATAGVVSPSC